MEKQFGDLIIAFTSSFNLMYNDRGSGASKDGAFWHPVPPAGFNALGGVGVSNYDDINGNDWALCVKAAENPSLPNPILPPLDYDLIWADHGSGAEMDGSCWRPKAPEGYVSLGDVFVTGYNKPGLDMVVCVRKDYTNEGVLGNEIWNDRGSGAPADIDVFAVATPKSVDIESQIGYFSPNTYVANNRYAPIVGSCLVLPLISETNAVPQPFLESTNVPGPTPKIVDRKLCVPFTAVTDNEKSVGWKVANSPFYYIEREAQYELVLFDFNQQSHDQSIEKTITEGTTKEQRETFSETSGISVSVEAGIEAIGLTVSASYSYEMGWESSTSLQQFQETAVNLKLDIPGKTAAAIWVLGYSLCFSRMANDYLPNRLNFTVDVYSQSQFPNDGQQLNFVKSKLSLSMA